MDWLIKGCGLLSASSHAFLNVWCWFLFISLSLMIFSNPREMKTSLPVAIPRHTLLCEKGRGLNSGWALFRVNIVSLYHALYVDNRKKMTNMVNYDKTTVHLLYSYNTITKYTKYIDMTMKEYIHASYMLVARVCDCILQYSISYRSIYLYR